MFGKSLAGRSWPLNIAVSVFAISTGCLGFYGTQQYLKLKSRNLEQDVQVRFRTQEVIVASRDLARGEKLEATAMAIRQMPVRYLPGGSLGPAAASKLYGKRLNRDLQQGDPVVQAALQPHGAQGLSQILTPGLRAITFGVDEINSFAGLLKTGDLIDLYYTAEQAGGRSRLVLLLEAVPVIATGVRTTEPSADQIEQRNGAPTGFDTVTLQVSPDDAARIVLAQRSGQVTAVLRNPRDQGNTKLTFKDSQALLRQQQSTGSKGSSDSGAGYIPLIVGGNGGPVAAMERMLVGDRNVSGFP